MKTMRDWHDRTPFAARIALVGAALVFAVSLGVQLILGDEAATSPFVVSALTSLAYGALSYVLARRHGRRIEDLVHLTEAWLRGNLALRANASGQSELAALADQLNTVIEHLEEDEQDLDVLRESNTRLTDQVRALAVVEERNRLARELHDTVKQHLFSLAMTAGAVRTHVQLGQGGNQPIDEEMLEMVREMETAAQIAQQETTRLIEDLRPAPLQERGLAAALNDYALLFGARQHILVYLDVQCNDQWLPAVVTEALYRVTQEALHNVARHAKATRVDIQLSCTAHRVTLSIEDNGIGFDSRRTRKGLGISSMQERIMAIGGRLKVISEPGVGTTIQAEADVSQRDTRPFYPFAGTDAVPEEPSGGITRLPQTTSEAAPNSERIEGRWSAPAYVAPVPRPENWAWLGEQLVIPVGQVWPWLPVHQDRYLRQPLIPAGSLLVRQERQLLGLRHVYALFTEGFSDGALVRLVPERGGYHWDLDGADWTLRRMRGLRGRAILTRNDQALAAMQYRGRQMDMWTEIFYDSQLYRLTYGESSALDFVLLGDDGGRRLETQLGPKDFEVSRKPLELQLHEGLPLPLLAMTLARIIDEASTRPQMEAV